MADLLVYLRQLRKKNSIDRSSGYSMATYGEITPKSLDIWRDLPEVIKNDPILSPFKDLYEERQGIKKVESKKDTETSSFIKKDQGIETKKDNNMEAIVRLLETTDDEETAEVKRTKNKKAFHILRIMKLAVLVIFWVLITVALLLNTEKKDTVLHTAIKGGESKGYKLPIDREIKKVSLNIKGPFVKSGNSTNSLLIWLQMAYDSEENVTQTSEKWIVHLQPEEIDFSSSVSISKTLFWDSKSIPTVKNMTAIERNVSEASLLIKSSSDYTVPLMITYCLDTVSESQGILYSTILLLILYTLIIFEIVNRTIAALLTSSLSVAVLAMTGSRPSLEELVSWLDVETLVLLFSMMVLVAILAETGLFDRLAVIAFELTGGRTWPLINCLCFFTALFSTFLDNVTTILLMTPVTIRLCEIMELNPIPVLISMVIFSNVGGAATPVGDPPNVIIASQPFILHKGINFTTFTLHMGLGISLVCVQTYIQLRFIFRDIRKLQISQPYDLQERTQEIAIWKRAVDSLASSDDEELVKRLLEKKINKLNKALKRKETGGESRKSDPEFLVMLAEMKQKYYIRDKELLVKSSICILFVVIIFFLHSIPVLQRLSLAWTALLGALLLLLLSEREDLEPILARIEWSTLLFFAGLFILMEALTKLGLISWIGRITTSIILKVDEASRLAAAIMLILWVSGMASAFVDNIPLTTMMVRIIASLADSASLNLPVAPLAWALSFGACLGGNGTLIGASANVVCAGVAEQNGHKITFLKYLKIGFPVMIGNLVISSIYLLISHCLFQWH